VVPAELVAISVTVGTDPGTQPFHLTDQLFARHAVEIFVHLPLRTISARLARPRNLCSIITDTRRMRTG